MLFQEALYALLLGILEGCVCPETAVDTIQGTNLDAILQLINDAWEERENRREEYLQKMVDEHLSSERTFAKAAKLTGKSGKGAGLHDGDFSVLDFFPGKPIFRKEKQEAFQALEDFLHRL